MMRIILTNYELGWKTTLGPVRWNGAIFHDRWKKFQFAFLGANSFTEIHNARDAVINGIETDVSYIRGGLTLNAAAAYTDAKTKGNICTFAADTDPDCLGVVDGNQDFPAAPSGTRLPLTPKFKATATARYTWPAWADVKAHVQGSVSYRGSAPSSLHCHQACRHRGNRRPERVPGAPECRDARRPLRGSGLAELQFRDLHRQPVRQAHRS